MKSRISAVLEKAWSFANPPVSESHVALSAPFSAYPFLKFDCTARVWSLFCRVNCGRTYGSGLSIFSNEPAFGTPATGPVATDADGVEAAACSRKCCCWRPNHNVPWHRCFPDSLNPLLWVPIPPFQPPFCVRAFLLYCKATAVVFVPPLLYLTPFHPCPSLKVHPLPCWIPRALPLHRERKRSGKYTPSFHRQNHKSIAHPPLQGNVHRSTYLQCSYRIDVARARTYEGTFIRTHTCPLFNRQTIR